MTAMATDFELVSFESFDSSIKCQPFARVCENDADWLAIKSCGCDVPLCSSHKKIADEEHASGQFSIGCAICGEGTGTLLRWERIK